MGHIISQYADPAPLFREFAAHLGTVWTRLGPAGTFDGWTANAYTIYTTEYYALNDPASADWPYTLRLSYGTGGSGNYPKLTVTPGTLDAGTFTPATQGVAVETVSTPAPGAFLAAHSGGLTLGLEATYAGYGALLRIGRLREPNGTPHDGLIITTSNAYGNGRLIFTDGLTFTGGEPLGGAMPGSLRREGETDTPLLPVPLQFGGGLIAPSLTPWECWYAAPTDWTPRTRRQILLPGNRAATLCAPCGPNTTVIGGFGGYVPLTPLEVPA